MNTTSKSTASISEPTTWMNTNRFCGTFYLVTCGETMLGAESDQQIIRYDTKKRIYAVYDKQKECLLTGFEPSVCRSAERKGTREDGNKAGLDYYKGKAAKLERDGRT